MKKSKDSKCIQTHMANPVSSTRVGKSRDMQKGPRKYAKGEVTNEYGGRPPKR